MLQRCMNLMPTSQARLVLPAVALLAASVWAARPVVRTDAYGDPLPYRALTRLGTTRLQLGGVNLLRFSPDGKILASAGKKAAVRFWEVATGNEIRTLRGITDDVEDLAFAPDGKLLAVATARRIDFFDPASGAKLPREAGTLFCSCLVFSPDSKLLAASDGEHDLFLFDAATGKQIERWEANDQRIGFLAFTPDGKGLISAGLSRRERGDEPPRFTYRLWDPASGQKRAEVRLPAHLGAPTPLGFADGKTWTVLCYDLLAERRVFWQPATGKELAADDGMASRWFVPSQDGRTVAGLGNKAVDFWDVSTGKRLDSLSLENNSPPGGVALSPDGRTFAFVASDSTAIRLYDRKTRSQRLAIETHSRPITAIVVAPDGRTVATGSKDGSVRLWETATGKPLPPFFEKESGAVSPTGSVEVTHLAFTPDGRKLVAARHGGAIQVWNVADGRLAGNFGSSDALRALLVAPDSMSLILATETRQRRLELATGKELGSVSFGPKADGWALSPDGRLFVRAERGRLFFHEVDNPKKVRETKLEQGGQTFLGGPAFSPDGLLVMVVGRGKIWLLDAVTGFEIAQISHRVRDCSRGVAFSPDGQWLRLSDERGHHLLDVVTGKELWSLPEAKGPVAFTPDSKALVAGEESCTALVWDLTGLVPLDEPLEAQPQAALQALATDLASSNGLRAYWAFRRLRAEPRVAIPLIRTARAEDERIGRLIRDLDDDKFLVRQRATQELAGLGTRAAAALFKTLEEQPSLELRQRVERLLVGLNGPAAERRVRWAVKLVEMAGTREAYQILQELADGATDAPTTKEAKAALQRLPKPRE